VRILLANALGFAGPPAILVVLSWTLVTSYPTASGRALGVAALGLAAAIPTLLTAFVSGTVADRSDRRRLLRAANAVQLGSVVALAGALYWRPEAFVTIPGISGFALPAWAVLALPLYAVLTVGNGLARPAFNAALPRVVPAGSLGAANGRILTVGLTASALGALTVGALTAFVGPVAALVVPTAFFAVATGALASLRADLATARGPARAAFLTDAQEGFRYLARNRALLEVTVTAVAINFLSAVVTVELSYYVLEWLASNAVALGAMSFAAGIGAAVGSSAVNVFRWEPSPGRFLAIFVVLQGGTVLLLPLTHSVWVAVPDAFLFGVFPGMYATVFVAAVQRTVPENILGRVFAADEFGSFGMIPVGQYFGGLLTAARGIRITYLVAGGGIALVGVLMATLRDLRRFGSADVPQGGIRTGPPHVGGVAVPDPPRREGTLEGPAGRGSAR
jgi:hypothetical protein